MQLIVVGAGWAGERHVLAIQALERLGEDVHVRAIVDIDVEHLKRQAEAWGIQRTHADLGSALEAHPDAEAVVLATPHQLHRRGTVQAAASGRHVLVEKPMALTLGDGDAMIDACADAGTTLMVAESARYRRRNMVARDVLASGRLGRLLSGRIDMIGRGRHTYQYPGRRAWLADPAAGGSGIWMLNGIHVMSTARMLLGEVRRIYAREVHSPRFASELEATVVALLDFESGAIVTMTVSAELHGYRRFGNLVVFGEDGTLSLSRDRADEVHVYSEDSVETLPCGESDEGVPAHFVRQMQEFVRAVTESREPYTSGRVERGSLAAVLAGYESIRTGEAVTLPK